MFFPTPDLPPDKQEMVVCSITAAVKYEMPANLMLAVAEKEGGKPGQWVKNKNGTSDVGPMQFNTAYLKELRRYGIEPEHVAAAGCYSYELAAWRISNHLRNDQGDLWTKAANYHSRTPKYNARYRADLVRRAKKWGAWLSKHYKTKEMPVETVTAPRTTQEYRVDMKGYTPRTVTSSR
jgi:hypothetical protein